VFIAFPSIPAQIGDTIERGVEEFNRQHQQLQIKTWPTLDIAGKFIADMVTKEIDQSDYVIADISRLNFNVVYEIGYGIGREKQIIPIVNSAIVFPHEIERLGIFDTLGYRRYTNSSDFRSILLSLHESKSLVPAQS